MSGQQKCFDSLTIVAPISIGLPDGTCTAATRQGSVKLGSNLKLDNFLYVPTLTCNLISVSQLLADTSCSMMFTNELCLVQDPISRTLTGVGEQRNGVYVFQDILNPQVHKMQVVGA